MNDTTTKLPENLQKVIDANVSDSPAMLGDLTAAELQDLRAAEEAGEDRKGLVEAIEAEQQGRAKEADDALAMASEAAEKAGRDRIDAADAESQRAENDKLRAENEQLKSDLAAAKKKQTGRTPAKGKKAKPRTLELGKAKLDESHTVAFADAEGRTLPDLPEMEFSAEAFKKSRVGSGIELTEEIAFAESVSKTQVSQLFLVDAKGNAGGKAVLVNPITVGGGSKATFPANSLVFRGEPEAPAAK